MKELDLLKKIEKLNKRSQTIKLNLNDSITSISEAERILERDPRNSSALLTLQIHSERKQLYENESFMQKILLAKTRWDLKDVRQKERQRNDM